jgi:hypothetical protein
VLDAIGQVLPAAVGVALSPFPIIAVVLVLGTPRARPNGLAFAAGWIVGLALVTAVGILVTGGADDPASDASTVVSWVRVVLGVALIAAAGRKWRSRARPGEEPATPAWMASLDGIGPSRALGLGGALGGVNPKNLALTFAAASSIAAAGLEGADAGIAGATYVALASSTVLGAVVVHLVAGTRSAPALASVKAFMLAHDTAIMVVVLLVLGAKVLGDGLAGL